jgi:putative transcriptional regulator
MTETDITAETKAQSMAEELGRLFPERGKGVLWKTRLREMRKAAKLTLDRAATAVGLSLGYLSQLELGKNTPTLAVAFRIAKFYGCAVEYLWVEPVTTATEDAK